MIEAYSTEGKPPSPEQADAINACGDVAAKILLTHGAATTLSALLTVTLHIARSTAMLDEVRESFGQAMAHISMLQATGGDGSDTAGRA